jgi:hypothetical protein
MPETLQQEEEQWKKDTWDFIFKFRRHWDFWIISVLGSSALIIVQWSGFITTLPTPIIWLVAMLGIVMASFKTWRDQKRIAESKELELAQSKKANDHEKLALISQHIQQRQELEKKNQELAEKFERFLDKSIAKAALGSWLERLRICRNEVREVSGYGYNKDVAKEKTEKINQLASEVSDSLNRHLGFAEAEMFAGAKPAPLSEPQTYDMFTEGQQTRQWHLNVLDVKYAELKKIIERLN